MFLRVVLSYRFPGGQWLDADLHLLVAGPNSASGYQTASVARSMGADRVTADGYQWKYSIRICTCPVRCLNRRHTVTVFRSIHRPSFKCSRSSASRSLTHHNISPPTMIIDTHQLPESALSLYFERDNPCNTTIVDQDRNTLYTVATDFANPDKPVTRVHDGIGKLVAEWIWRDSRSEILTIQYLAARRRLPAPG
jgi:hypothetical protein